MLGANVLVFAPWRASRRGRLISLARDVRQRRREHKHDCVRWIIMGFDGAAAPAGAVLRLRNAMGPAGACPGTRPQPACRARDTLSQPQLCLSQNGGWSSTVSI